MVSLEEARRRAEQLKRITAAVDAVQPEEGANKPPEAGTPPAEAIARDRTGLREALARMTSTSGADPSGTALYEGMIKVRETGTLGVELARQIESMQSKIDARMVRIFSIMDEASGRALDGEAYVYDPATGEPVPIDNNNFNDQLTATMRTAEEFAKIVEVLPQEVATLVTELDDSEKALGSILLREPVPAPSTPPRVDPWNPATAPQLPASEMVERSLPQMPASPSFEHGGRETGRVFNVAANMLGAIQDLKRRVDAQTIQILKTINEAATRGLDGTAYTDEGGTIAAVTDDANMVNRLETTVNAAKDLVETMRRLPDEVLTLVSEIRDAERRFFSVLNTNNS